MTRVACLALFLIASPLRAEILKVEVEGAIDPITAEFIASAVRQAEERQAEFLLIRLSTPGGLGISMQEIVQQILGSKVPVVCFVHPQGTHAASAGFFVLLAADVAVMSPGTNTGAATPIFPFGMENEVLLEKVKQDALASLRSIAEGRQRNSELAEKAVSEARSFTEKEALEGNLIDFVAEDETALLTMLHDREIKRFNGEVQRLKTQGQEVVLLEMTLRQRVLATVADPNLAILLALVGILGLYFEFNNPGLIFPAVIGGICLLLSLIGFYLLPVNLIGVLLVVLALGLFIAEIKVQGFGILGIGGVVALFLGLLLLIDSPFPELRIQAAFALGVAVGFSALFLLLLRLAYRAFSSPVQTGNESLVGVIGVARTDIDSQRGKVFVNGERWDAVSAQPIAAGSKVRVVVAQRLLLTVEDGTDR